MTTLLAFVTKWEQVRKTDASGQSEAGLVAGEDAGAAAGAIAGLLGPTSRYSVLLALCLCFI